MERRMRKKEGRMVPFYLLHCFAGGLRYADIV